MENYPCTCGGENQNCFRCDGTGLVKSQALPLRSDGRVRPLPKNDEIQIPTSPRKIHQDLVKPQIEKKYFCPKCNEFFDDPTLFIHHVRTFHPKPKPNPKPNSNSNSKPKLNSTKLDNPQKVDQYQIEIQPMEDRLDPEPMTLELIGENQRLLNEARAALKKLRRSYPDAHLCKTCMEIFKTTTDLVAHQQEMHVFKPIVVIKNKKKTASRKKSKIQKQSDEKNLFRRKEEMGGSGVTYISTQTNDRDNLERRMDATYGMGGFARDYGQFGSSPSYDGMDDESLP
jgi:uncharacterized C2H2 Zn-finger protein